MKDWFNNTILTHKKRYIVVGIVLLIVFTFSTVIYFSYGYYEARSSNLLVSGVSTIDTSDVRLRVYLQQTNSSGNPINNYAETKNEIPSNYVFNPEKSNCSEGLSIDEVNKNVFTVVSEKKGTCSVYLDYVKSDADITTKVYVETENGYQYVSTLPTDKKYFVNPKLSDCSGNAEVQEDGTIAAKGMATCSIVYGFMPFGTYLTTVVTDHGATSISRLIQHTPVLADSAGDNNYRYSGDEPYNYVCFGSDAATCPEDNLYRIIGVFDGKVKLIKYKSIGEYQWNDKDSNDWATASLNTNVLNKEFLNTFDNNWQNKIALSNWNIGISFSGSGFTPKEFYNNMIESSYVTAKIGLMYVSDYGYGFAANSYLWSRELADYGSQEIRISNWLYNDSVSIPEATINAYMANSRGITNPDPVASNGNEKIKAQKLLNSYNTYRVVPLADSTTDSNTPGNEDRYKSTIFSIYSTNSAHYGDMNANQTVDTKFYIRPVFYLKPSVVFVRGKGHSSDPYRIS